MSYSLRPELIRYLRAAKVKLISAGRQHSMAVSQTGLLFAFGSNSHGQCGLGAYDFPPKKKIVFPVEVFSNRCISL